MKGLHSTVQNNHYKVYVKSGSTIHETVMSIQYWQTK